MPAHTVGCFKRYVVVRKIFNTFRLVMFITGILVLTFRSAEAVNSIRILALGDSLTAGYGLEAEDSFTSQLQIKLLAMGYRVRVLNAGVSGDTSAGGLARLAWSLSDNPTHAIIELGANDGMRGLNPLAMRDNLTAIIRQLKAARVQILLTGMRAPPNFGQTYAESFNRVFPQLAKEQGVLFYPFFLEGVVAKPHLNLSDGIHPNKQGVAIIVDRITPYVVRLLKDLK